MRGSLRLAYAYDRFRSLPPEALGQIATAMAQVLPEEGVVLELGAGTGRLALPLIARGLWYIGLEADPHKLKLLQEKVRGVTRKVRLLQAEPVRIPLEAEEVHGVLAVDLWHRLPDWPRALAEALRVLKPGGVLLEGWEGVEGEEDWALQEKWRALAQEEGYPVERGVRQRRLLEVEKALKRLGLKPEAREVARWSETHPLRECLEALEARVYSFTELLPEEVHRRVMGRLWAWAEAEWGSLDRPIPRVRSFTLRFTPLV